MKRGSFFRYQPAVCRYKNITNDIVFRYNFTLFDDSNIISIRYKYVWYQELILCKQNKCIVLCTYKWNILKFIILLAVILLLFNSCVYYYLLLSQYVFRYKNVRNEIVFRYNLNFLMILISYQSDTNLFLKLEMKLCIMYNTLICILMIHMSKSNFVILVSVIVNESFKNKYFMFISYNYGNKYLY